MVPSTLSATLLSNALVCMPKSGSSTCSWFVNSLRRMSNSFLLITGLFPLPSCCHPIFSLRNSGCGSAQDNLGVKKVESPIICFAREIKIISQTFKISGTLKGVCHEIFWVLFCHVWIDLGLYKNLWLFFNFSVESLILYLHLKFRRGKCKKQVAKQCAATFFCKSVLNPLQF
jgi:hypothetical protein